MWHTLKSWMWRDFERTAEAGVALSFVFPQVSLFTMAMVGSAWSLAETARGQNLLPALTKLHR